MFSKQFVALVLCVLPVLAAPSPLVPVKQTTDAIPGRYIVTFKDDISHADGVSSVTSKIGSQSKVTHDWGTAINGLAGAFTDADLELVRSNPNVASIEQDGYAHTQTVVSHYDSTAGAGTDVYIIDTGILTTHPAFGEFVKAARSGELLCHYKSADGNGHGTHTAGTAVSGPYGVSKAAHVFAVKVLSDSGSGSWSDIISGMNWVATAAATSHRPSVASMSLGGSFISSVNTAANNLVASGVTTAVAA
ncbi:subtilisin-like protein, partial [Thelephora ganbajun]